MAKRGTEPKILYRTAQVRARDAGPETPGFDGHASTFWVIDAYGTAIKPGAFRKTLKERSDRVPLLWQHDPYQPIGRPTTLKEDKTGLAFSAEVVTETRAGAEAMALLRAETPLAMSFGFETIKSRPVEEGDQEHLDWSQAPAWLKQEPDYVSVIEEVRLWEISLVTFPANEAAAISNVRASLEADALSSLLESTRAGTLSDEQRAQIEQLVAAWTDQERAGAGPGQTPGHSTPPHEPARRAPHAVFDLIFAAMPVAGGIA